MMQVDTTVNAHEANELATELRRMMHVAEPALEDQELQTLSEAAEWIEDAGGIETGEQLMESPTTGTTYRVTRWIDAGDGKVVALNKEEVE